ncbi:receptor-type tyrosine-protein phosphatase N2 [Spea bombifrons]|uniref:receptor-type tyrosine-protein phosphatase N2 n=1 Tax=Spea bombifrons TaxID=233779 RepID=UPI002349E486|nr:receptor-type tyrosine-protein phosphatase N2 [Spea bombifrons]
MVGSINVALLLLLAFIHPFTASGETEFGCLFEDDLCKPFEMCLNDGVFGRCQRMPVIDVFKYEVSPSAVKRLRTILQELSRRGFTWKDDYTQRIIAGELSNLRKIYNRQPEANPLDGSGTARTFKPNSETEKNYELDKNKKFAKSFHQYLQYLGILPQSASPSFYPKTKTETPPITKDINSEVLIDRVLQKSQANSPTLSFASVPHQTVPENLPSKSLTQLPKESEADHEKKSLLAALKAYLAQKAMVQNPDNLESNTRAKVTSLFSNRHYSPQPDGVLPKDDGKDGLKTKPFVQRPRNRISLRPNTGSLIYKSSSRHQNTKDPLSAVDETFIQNVVKELGKHKLNLDSFSPKELDELADVIADTLQIVDGDQPNTRRLEGGRAEQEMKRTDAYESRETGDQNREINITFQGQESSGKDSQSEIKDKGTSSSKEDFSDFTINPVPKEFKPEELFNPELQKYGDFHYISDDDGEEKVGIENVKSEAYTRELTAQKKAVEDADSTELIELQHWIKESLAQDGRTYQEEPNEKVLDDLKLQVKSSTGDQYGYIETQKTHLSAEKGVELLKEVAVLLKQQMNTFSDISVYGSTVLFQVRATVPNITNEDVAMTAAANKEKLENSTGLKILQTGVGQKSKLKFLTHHLEEENSTKFIILTLISIVCIIGVLTGSGVIYCLRHRSHHKLKEKLSALASDTSTDATNAYQELCRQRMAVKTSDRPEPLHSSRINSISSQFSDGPMQSPTARSSTSSWSEEPVQSNMDISTGHMILSYMEDHLKNKNRLEKEWEALCAYQAEPNSTLIAHKEANIMKNRSMDVVTYDHNRIILKAENSHDNSDYINASPIMDHDPRNPAYIATQGPLPSTVADFWQMVWENGCVVIVMLTSLAENGVKQCYHYWPDEGSNLYNIYEVNLVSEHIWCDDFLVRSFYLKNLQTNETRTVTQFNFLTWNDHGVPASTRSLLDFRRKVNKCYKGRSRPVIIHCSDGAGRSGTYILIDMVLNKMAKGAKEIDIAATLEHLRDQRPGMVQTKEQFEFALTAVAEEVNAILKALPQ